ncbi:MAG: hypothetical protein WCS37_12730 [Chloroflexota bacterium]
MGQDYWCLADQLPSPPKHIRLQVLPVYQPGENEVATDNQLTFISGWITSEYHPKV